MNINDIQGSIEGVGCFEFLQLLNMQKATCILEVKHKITNDICRIFLKNGDLVHATLGEFVGINAIYKLATWDNEVKIQIYPLNGTYIPQTINERLEFILLESVRIQDELKHKSGNNVSNNIKKEEMTMKLQDTQDVLKRELDGFVACAVVDVIEGLPLAGSTADPNFDIALPAGYYTDTFSSAVKSFDSVGWGIPQEVLIPGDTHTILLIALKGGRYYQSITTTSKTPLGMIRAVFNKIKPAIEKLLP